jgi:hypothetical protein
MRIPRILLTFVLAAGALVACSTGTTNVSGLSGGSSGASGPTQPSGSTGATSVTGISGEFSGPVSIELAGVTPGVPIEQAFFSCDGVLSTWRYIFKVEFGSGIAFDVDTTVDLSSGAGTLVFGDTVEVAQVGSVTFEDTVDIEVAGTADAPTLLATNVSVKITGTIPLPEDVFKSFAKDVEIPVVQGAERC